VAVVEEVEEVVLGFAHTPFCAEQVFEI